MFKKIAINARYFIAPLLILATLFGVLAGGPWVWTGVFLLGVGIVIDTLYTQQTMGAGFDEEGEATKATHSFLQKNNVVLSDLKTKETPKGDRLFLERL